MIGSGSFGSVKKAIRISDGKEVAIKIIPKRNVKNHFDMVKDEVDVLSKLSHPNVIGFYDTFESRYIDYFETNAKLKQTLTFFFFLAVI